MTTLTTPAHVLTIPEPLCIRRPALRPFCVRAGLARTVVERVLDGVQIRAIFPDGRVRGGGGPDAPTMEIVDPVALYERLAHNPKVGLGEAYMAGDWRAAPGSDLGALLTPFAQKLTSLVPRPLLKLRGVVDQRIPQRLRNTLVGSRQNISAHYDLSNELFGLFLDDSLSYSSAWFDAQRPFLDQSLESAQHRKIERILDLARVGPGSRVLEIGTGWGALAVAAGRRGATVTTITLSAEQLDLARRRVREAGLQDNIDLRLQDYREVTGVFDAIVSVEMIEAVGEEYWAEYFAVLDRLLAPGGTVALQAIVMDHDRLLATRRSFSWIQKYIFPGGLIPSLRAIEDTCALNTDLILGEGFLFGQHYAETLRRWRASVMEQRESVLHLGFDEVFLRMWEFYLAYSEAGFASGYLNVAQLQLTRRAT